MMTQRHAAESTALDADEALVWGEDIDRDLDITSRCRRKKIEQGIIPSPDGSFAGRNFWKLSTYKRFKADLLAGKFAGPGRRPPGQRHRSRSAA